MTKKQVVIKNDPRNNDQRNTKKVKQKHKGKSQRLKMGLGLNHVYWWPETMLALEDLAPNALKIATKKTHVLGTPQPTNSWS